MGKFKTTKITVSKAEAPKGRLVSAPVGARSLASKNTTPSSAITVSFAKALETQPSVTPVVTESMVSIAAAAIATESKIVSAPAAVVVVPADEESEEEAMTKIPILPDSRMYFHPQTAKNPVWVKLNGNVPENLPNIVQKVPASKTSKSWAEIFDDDRFDTEEGNTISLEAQCNCFTFVCNDGKDNAYTQAEANAKLNPKPAAETKVNVPAVATADVEQKKDVCLFWTQGYCKNGDNCKYSHPSLEIDGKKPICQFWIQGNCKNRSVCMLDHPPREGVATKPVCIFWIRGTCRKDESSCSGSHAPREN